MSAPFPVPRSASSAATRLSPRLGTPLVWGLAVLAAVAVLHVRDPHQTGSYGFCPWLLLTGTYCPGCGGLRAVHDLSHGDVAAALSSNVLVVALIPVAVLLWAGWMWARWRDRAHPVLRRVSPLLARRASWSMLAVLLVFGVVRNLAFAGWLAP